MRIFLKILGVIFLLVVVVAGGGLLYLNLAFPKTEAPADITVEVTPERIARGKYLANHVAVCMDCHAERDFTKFAGPIKEETFGAGGEVFDENMGFPGAVYTKNITQDKETGIGDWTDGEIIRAVTCGVNKDGEALFPLMPYTNYNTMTEEDLYSIVAYVKSLSPVKKNIPERKLNFPLNLIVKTIPFERYQPSEPIEDKTSIEYGKYLVTMASCAECHTKSEKGEPVPGMEFAGGNDFGGPFSVVRSMNITPDKETGIGNWSKEEFIAKFKINSPDSSEAEPVGEKDFNTVMPWRMYADMTEEDLGAMFDYLMTLKPVKNRVERFSLK